MALVLAHNAIRNNVLWPRRFRRPIAVAAAAAVALLAVALVFWQQTRPDVFRTGFGERHAITLADGSQLTLDSRSEVAVRYTSGARSLTLLRGQARFDVAHDVERPFTVTVDGRKVVATGTAFDIDLLGSDLRVTLIKGHVVVVPQNAPTIPWSASAKKPATAGQGSPVADTARIELAPGEQLFVSGDSAPRVVRVDLDRVTAWERGEVEFNDEPMSAVVRRMNRYALRQVIVGDERAADLRISGIFHEGDVDGFVSTLASYLPVQVHDQPDGSVLVTYSASRSGD